MHDDAMFKIPNAKLCSINWRWLDNGISYVYIYIMEDVDSGECRVWIMQQQEPIPAGGVVFHLLRCYISSKDQSLREFIGICTSKCSSFKKTSLSSSTSAIGYQYHCT